MQTVTPSVTRRTQTRFARAKRDHSVINLTRNANRHLQNLCGGRKQFETRNNKKLKKKYNLKYKSTTPHGGGVDRAPLTQRVVNAQTPSRGARLTIRQKLAARGLESTTLKSGCQLPDSKHNRKFTTYSPVNIPATSDQFIHRRPVPIFNK
jgi:hypothetical protein